MTLLLTQILKKNFLDKGLIEKLEETWKKSYQEGRFTVFDDLLYHTTKHSYMMVIVDRQTINFLLQQCHDCIYSAHLSSNRTLEKVSACESDHLTKPAAK